MKKHRYRKQMFNSLVHLQEIEKNKSIVKAAILLQSKRAIEVENKNAKVLKYILPINVLFIGYFSVAMALKFFIIFFIFISIHMVTFIFDKTLNIKFNEAILKLLDEKNI